jgi:iron complex outermembrane receptor protein
MNQLISLLHEGGFSCVIANHGETRTFSQRGVADLYELYNTDPAFMQGATIADKVVGKGAAALMIMGGMVEVYADVVSTPARKLFEQYGVKLSCGKEVPHIINRQQTGYCPLETACGEETDLQRLYQIISGFVAEMKKRIF